MTEIINCVFMDKLYGVRPGDIVTTEDAYWIDDELIITSLYVGENYEIPYSANRIIEMKIEDNPNIRITAPIVGSVVGRIIFDNFRDVTLFSLDV